MNETKAMRKPMRNFASRKNLVYLEEGGNDLSKPVLDTSNEFNKNFPLFSKKESNFFTFLIQREVLQVGYETVPGF